MRKSHVPPLPPCWFTGSHGDHKATIDRVLKCLEHVGARRRPAELGDAFGH